MKEPNIKDFTGNRQVRSRKYNEAMVKYRAFIKKNKPVDKDPRPKFGDFPNREAYRQSVLKWNERRRTRLKKERKDDLTKRGLKDTSRGVRPITSGSGKNKTNLKIKKKKPYAADKVGYVDKNSKEYKAAVEMTNRNPINKDKPENKKVDKKVVKNEPYVDPDKADKEAEKNFRSGSSVEEAKQKSDPLRKYRRGGDTGRKETRITKKLKKAGFTSDRLAKLRKKNAEFQKAKKGGKEAMKAYRKKYPKRG
jgi:hypothetical protein